MIVEAVVHYQRTGDGPADLWAQERLRLVEESGSTLPGSMVLGEWQAGWVQVVLFTIRFGVNQPGDEAPWDMLSALALDIAEETVGEMDVQILGLKVVSL